MSFIVVMAIGVSLSGSITRRQHPAPRLPEVVASLPGFLPTPDASASGSALVASMSTGMPVWPALLMAEESSVRVATAELEAASWQSAASRE